MRRPVTLATLVLGSVVALPVVTRAQSADSLIHRLGAFTPVPDPGFRADRSLTYRIAWDVTAAPEKPGEIAPGFRRPANFLTMTDAEGVPRAQVQLAIIVFGPATRSLMHNAAYKAATGSDNGSIPLLEALHAAGVQVIVCGQAMARTKVTRDQLLPFVQVATSATLARATLAARGYATFAQ